MKTEMKTEVEKLNENLVKEETKIKNILFDILENYTNTQCTIEYNFNTEKFKLNFEEGVTENLIDIFNWNSDNSYFEDYDMSKDEDEDYTYEQYNKELVEQYYENIFERFQNKFDIVK